MTKLDVAVVTPWFGAELTGGAERTAWQLALGLVERGHRVTVFTTCAEAFASDWSIQARRRGTTTIRGVCVRRFSVDARDADAFDRANEVLLSQSPVFYARHTNAVDGEIAAAFSENSIHSSELIWSLRDEVSNFDAVIILPYPFGLCVRAVEEARKRAILIPCLHDESYAYLPVVANAFREAGMVAFNTAGEQRLAYRIFGPALALKSFVLGQWVDAPTMTGLDSARIVGINPKNPRYLLYLGRRDATKNVDMLVESFATFRRRERMSALELVLVGPGRASYSDARHGIADLGEVDDAKKEALLAHAWVVVQPSINESYSRVVTEAWRLGTPVAVNARCEATCDAVVQSRGGWIAESKAQWSSLFHAFDRMTQRERDDCGARGRNHIEQETSQDVILDRLEKSIRTRAPSTPVQRFEAAPAADLMRRLEDGRRNILYAGPLEDGSRIEQLLTGFAFLLSFGIDARLTLLGEFNSSEMVAQHFFRQVAGAGLVDRTLVFETNNSAVRAACYRSADLFWSMAGEGPSTALFDALGYGVPIFAFSNDGSRQILGSSGILFHQIGDFRLLAGIAALILTDRQLCGTLVDGQRRRFEALCREESHSLAV